MKVGLLGTPKKKHGQSSARPTLGESVLLDFELKLRFVWCRATAAVLWSTAAWTESTAKSASWPTDQLLALSDNQSSLQGLLHTSTSSSKLPDLRPETWLTSHYGYTNFFSVKSFGNGQFFRNNPSHPKLMYLLYFHLDIRINVHKHALLRGWKTAPERFVTLITVTGTRRLGCVR